MAHHSETPGDLWRRAQRARNLARMLADEKDEARLLEYAAALEAQAKQLGYDPPSLWI